MKKIKIKLIGFWPSFDFRYTDFYHILSKYYDVKICDDADYIICSCFGEPYEYCKFPQIRIMFSGENYIPDLNFIDYAICEYPISFLDRCFCRPGFMEFQSRKVLYDKKRKYDKEFLQKKEFFANFIYSHPSENNIRDCFFQKLSKYKRIESAGSHLNNMPDGKIVQIKDGSKYDLQKKCKFSLCFESTKHEGFITEKIVDGFYNDTIPIYYGSSTVKDYFNPNAFINYNDFKSEEELIRHIIQIDKDDEEYLRIMNEPILRNDLNIEQIEKDYEAFVCNIFNQPIKKAYRRSRVYTPKRHENYILNIKKIQSLLQLPIKGYKFILKIKRKLWLFRGNGG